jgi:Protein of unknown function (DUF3040)
MRPRRGFRGAIMSISEQEQETLDSIEDRLVRSAPELASMLAIFSRLTADEQMPVREQVRRAARGLGASAAAAAGLMTPGRIRLGHAGRWLWLVAAVALLALTLAMSHDTASGACTVSSTAACGQAPGPAHPGTRWPAGL